MRSVNENNQKILIRSYLLQTFFGIAYHHSRMWSSPRRTSVIGILLFVCFLCLCTVASDEVTPVPTVSINPINLTTMPIVIHHTSITPFPTTQPVHEGPWIFSGQVLRGASWEAAEPVSGTTISCHCSNDPRETGPAVASTITDSYGGYAVAVSEACRFYTLAVAGEPATDTISVSGTVLPGGAIRFEEPLYGKNLTGNLFFFSTGEIPATPTHAGSPVPAGTRFSPDTPLSGFLVILAIGVVGMCAVLMKRGN